MLVVVVMWLGVANKVSIFFFFFAMDLVGMDEVSKKAVRFTKNLSNTN